MSNVIIDDQRGNQKARSRQNLETIMHYQEPTLGDDVLLEEEILEEDVVALE